MQRLDYLQWLGIDCLWLPPFYASPLRDGGYDISDYTAVLPEFGTLPEFPELVSQAHARGIRIVTDLVMNHTSDQHPWFQASRADPEGPYGDFYVWSDTDDEVRRRPHHLRRHRGVQLDLRPGAPAVLLAPVLLPPARPQLREPRRRRRRCSTSSGSGWTSGIDGFRLDAVPYLFEEEGTQLREPARRRTSSSPSCARWSTQEYPGRDPARRGQPAARRRSSTTSAPRRRPSARCASTSP